MGLDLDTTYRAILQAALKRSYITYGEIAAAHGVPWSEAQSVLPAQLESLMGICHAAGWPFLPAIVFHEPALGHVGPAGTREHLVGIARKLGTFVSDVNAFIRTEQDRVFEWAPTAPPHLSGDARGEAASAPAPAGRLELATTFRALVRAARARSFLTYGDIAAASNVVWNTVRTAVPAQLDTLMGICHRQGWPFLPVIVVNARGRESGEQIAAARDKLVSVARSLGVAVEDPETFIAAEQARVFEWAPTAPEELPAEDGARAGVAPVSAPVPAAGGGMAAGPHFLRYFGPVLDALRALGGTANAATVIDWISRNAQMPGEELVARTRSGKPAFANRVGWARFYLDRGGFLTSPQRGVWALTARGRGTHLDLASANEVFRETRAAAGWGQTTDDEDAPAPETTTPEAAAAQEVPRSVEPVAAIAPVVSTPVLHPLPPYTLADIASEGGFLAEDVLARALDRWKVRRNLILQGPPGTGKSWLARRLAAVLLGSRDPRAGLRAVQFHPALSYEEFVRGWRPEGDGRLALVDGPFLECVTAARAEPDRPVVLLIEEINRGNPARIFGDMLTLIEDSKRRPDEAIELSARREPAERIFVPDNLFLLGTMNIADRSLAMVDFALRRRFAFLDLAPAFNERWQDWCVTVCGLDAALIGQIRARLTDLNAEIAGDRGLGPQFRIGHSFLTPRRDAPPADTALWFRETVETEIGPLLEEYWFDNPDRAREAVDALVVGF